MRPCNPHPNFARLPPCIASARQGSRSHPTIAASHEENNAASQPDTPHAAQARPALARMRDVPGCERRRVRPRRRGPDGGAAPDAPAMPRRAAHAQPADGADGGRVDGADAGRGRLLLLGQGSARPVRRFRRGLPDNSLHRRRYGDLSRALRQLPFVHRAARSGRADRDRHRAGMAGGRAEFSRRQAGRASVDTAHRDTRLAVRRSW